MAKVDLTFERGLPADPLAERMVLGSILVYEEAFDKVSEILTADDFSLEKHRRIWSRMQDLRGRGENIDRVTLMSELMRQGQLESVDGATYLASLDQDLPVMAHPQSYARIVQSKSALRRLIFAGQKLVDGGLIADSSPEDLVTEHFEVIRGIQESRAPVDDGGRTPEQIVTEYSGGLDAFMDPSRRPVGLLTGFAKFDEMTGGLQEGELIIIAGRPSMGKTAFALNIAQYMATHPRERKRVAIFSLEMAGHSLMTRMMCAAARVDAHKFRAGYLNQDERRKLQVALADLLGCGLKIYDRSEMSLNAMCAAIRRLVDEEGIHLAIIDYLQLLAGVRKRTSDNRTSELSEMTRTLKLLAGECEIPIIVLSQLSRACETRPGDHRPQLSDLRDSGSIEQDADMVGFVYREEVYKRDREDLRGLAELLLAKQRNGPIGKVPLRFLGQFIKFENRAEDLPEEAEY